MNCCMWQWGPPPSSSRGPPNQGSSARSTLPHLLSRAQDWHAAATQAGNAVLTVNPHLLIIVERNLNGPEREWRGFSRRPSRWGHWVQGFLLTYRELVQVGSSSI